MLLTLTLAACGGTKSSTSTTQTPAPAAGSAAKPAGGCENVPAPAAKPAGHERRPTRLLERSRTWELVAKTSCGDFTVRLNLSAAPHAAASMVALARAGFFRKTVFHRIVPGFVIQGGDPTASGQGGPGYSTVDPPPSGTRYTTGVVAMAKTQTEPPGTAGSQFYVVTAPDAQLPPDYALLGKVTQGLDVVERIGRLGDPQSGGTGTPTQPVVVQDVVVR